MKHRHRSRPHLASTALLAVALASASGCMTDDLPADPAESLDSVDGADEGASAGEAGPKPWDPDEQGGGDEPASLQGGTPIAARTGVIGLEYVNGVHFCTGFLASNRVAVTAAHCLAGLLPGGARQGRTVIKVKYFDPTGGTRYITDPEGESVTIHTHPGYIVDDDDDDVEHDVGVIIRDTQWTDTGSRDYLRFYDDDFGKVGRLQVYGAGVIDEEGTGGGVLRWSEFSVDWFNTYYSITLASSTRRVCSGDSGGPALKVFTNSQPALVGGIHTLKSVSNINDRCTRSGGNQRHTRLNPEKIAWFESVTGVRCHRLVLGNDFKYARCFEYDRL